MAQSSTHCFLKELVHVILGQGMKGNKVSDSQVPRQSIPYSSSFLFPPGNSTSLWCLEVKITSLSSWSFLNMVLSSLNYSLICQGWIQWGEKSSSLYLAPVSAPQDQSLQPMMKQSPHVMPESAMWLLSSAQINTGLGSVGQTLPPAVFSSHSLGRCSNSMRLTTS